VGYSAELSSAQLHRTDDTQGVTNFIYENLSAIVADHLKQFLDLRHETCPNVSKDRSLSKRAM